jgi:glycosyltransferase involved in cell wall biosynthesis
VTPTPQRPQLACAVLALRDPPELVDAVRSVITQRPPIEVVVVNSGGGDPDARLAAAGLEVPVINRAEPLYPGDARNLGIDATNAPFVAFLAADCVAEPGWAANRLRRHESGAEAVAGAITNAYPGSASASASYVLLHHRRMPWALEEERLAFSLSYARSLFARFGRFREDLRQDEDTEFNSRFAELCPVAWADDVRARHRYPRHPLALVRDQYARGRRRAAADGRGEAWCPSVSPRHAVASARAAVLHVHRMAGREPRQVLVRSGPMLAPALLAYVAGLARGTANGSFR